MTAVFHDTELTRRPSSLKLHNYLKQYRRYIRRRGNIIFNFMKNKRTPVKHVEPTKTVYLIILRDRYYGTDGNVSIYVYILTDISVTLLKTAVAITL